MDNGAAYRHIHPNTHTHIQTEKKEEGTISSPHSIRGIEGNSSDKEKKLESVPIPLSVGEIRKGGTAGGHY